MALGEVASEVDRIEQRYGDDTASKDTLLIELHHVHRPVMDDVGTIACDPNSNRISIEHDLFATLSGS